MKKVKKEIVHMVEYGALSWVARFLYVAGLAALIPLLPLVFAPERIWEVKTAIAIAGGLIVLSFLLVFWFTRSTRKSLEALGFMTLIPGLLAVFFAYLGERPFIDFLARFGPVSPLLQAWLQNYVPKSWLLAGVYILLGTGLIYFSQNVRR